MKKCEDHSELFYEFIEKHLGEDTNSLRLRYAVKSCDFDVKNAIDQIEARRKTARKLSSFIRDKRFLFPSLLSAEQSTHELVALYNSSQTLRIPGLVVDMTAGLGIDALTCARAGAEVVAIELDPERARALCHNTRALGLSGHFRVVNADSILYLPRLKKFLESKYGTCDKNVTIFIDPARRSAANSRTYFLEDCVPDITKSIDILFSVADRILVKASPILDIKRAVAQLPAISEAHYVAVKGEMKEVLLLLEKQHPGDVTLKAVDLDYDTESDAKTPKFRDYGVMECLLSETGNSSMEIAETTDLQTGGYIYDPNAAVHKMQCGNSLSQKYPGLKRLGANTDIYFSNELFPDFPGRIFSLIAITDSKQLKKESGNGMSVISRNHPLSAEAIKKKFKLKESDTEFLMAVSVGRQSKPTFLHLHR